MSQSNQEAEESAYRLVALVGQLACIEAERGNRGAIKIACRCYTELNRAARPIPPMLRQFIDKRIEMVADGRSKEAFPIGRPNHPPREFDGLGFVLALVREWAESDVPASDFEKYFPIAMSGSLAQQFGVRPNGKEFDVRTFQRALKEHLPEALALLSIEANLGHK